MKLSEAQKQPARMLVSTVSQLSPDLYEKVRRLNFRDNGSMQGMLSRFRRTGKPARVYVLLNEDDMVLSWALVRGRKPTADAKKNPKKMRYSGETRPKNEVHFYTRAACRGKSLAVKIAKAVRKDYGKYVEHFPDSNNYVFFDKVGFSKSFTCWL